METDVMEQTIYDICPELLKILLSDKTTKKYIRWASDNYLDYGPEYRADQEIKPELIIGKMTSVIQPRVSKTDEEKSKRTRDKAEVFTPSWVCNEQNNLVDTAWFGRDIVFNIQGHKTWTPVQEAIVFPADKTWKEYVDARRMEISCGEAPYLVSRYDTVTGKMIPIQNRIGLLDRKLRVIGENAVGEEEWLEWTFRAFQSCYGYDYSGDNVFLARENLLCTFIEYMEASLGINPSTTHLKKIANIIAWNIWQMNGLTMTAPFSFAEPVYKQMSIFDLFDVGDTAQEETATNEMPCRIFDWRSNESLEFQSIIKEA